MYINETITAVHMTLLVQVCALKFLRQKGRCAPGSLVASDGTVGKLSVPKAALSCPLLKGFAEALRKFTSVCWWSGVANTIYEGIY